MRFREASQEILLQGGRLIDPAQNMDRAGDVLVRAGRIAAVGAGLEAKGAEVFDARGLAVCPGLVDIHVHFRTPGQEHKEDIVSGSAAAAMGGFTDVVCEPNTSPPLDSGVLIKQLLERARLESLVRLHVKGCMTLAGLGGETADFDEMRAYGAAAVSNDGEPIEDAAVMAAALAASRASRLAATIHAEEGGKVIMKGDSHRREPELVKRDADLAAQARAAAHFSHISTGEAVGIIADYKTKGVALTAEVTPHHLMLCMEDAPKGDTNFKMNPPLRHAADRQAVQKALVLGAIDCIATDHAPHTPEEKAAGFDAAPFGVIGMETALGVVLTTMYHSGLMNLPQIAAAMSIRPRRILGLPEVRLAEGNTADLTLFDPDACWVVEPERFFSKGRNCPFANRELKGKAVATIVAGRWVMRDGEISSAGQS